MKENLDLIIPKMYSDYGKYINEYRAFPYIIDGCKLVERRLLWALYEVAKNKFCKSATVVGHTIGRYHPHGDTSCYSSLVSLVQSGCANGQGNWGNNVGVTDDPPAAQRYTEVKCNPDILSMAFEYINYVPFEKVELDFEEPKFLPIKYPLCLVTNGKICEGIGFGYSTCIPSYKIEDLNKRLAWLLSDRSKPEPIIKPITKCTELSPLADFEKLLKTGCCTLQYKGIYTVEGNSIIIKSLPPSRSNFDTILSKFKKYIDEDKSLGFLDESTTETRVKLTILRPRILDINTIKTELDKFLTGSITFCCNVVNTSGKVEMVSIDKMLLITYNVYKNVVKTVHQKHIETCNEKIKQLNIISKIKPLLSTELKTNPDDVDLVISNISKQLNIDRAEISKLFSTYTISKIFQVKTDTNQYHEEIKEHNHILNTLDSYVWKEKYV